MSTDPESPEAVAGLPASRWWHPAVDIGRRLSLCLMGRSEFTGEDRPGRVLMFPTSPGIPSLPFPHLWNYREPIRILDAYFWRADEASGMTRHNRVLEIPGCSPVVVTRDPVVIRAVTTETGDLPGQFDRDTSPSSGIARATGPDTLLYSNGSVWRKQRKLAAAPFGKTTLFQPELFREFESAFRITIQQRLEALKKRLLEQRCRTIELDMEPEIKAVMLELLVNKFFGASVSYDELRNRHVPALERVIDGIVRDTVINPLGLPFKKLPAVTAGQRQSRADHATFDELTNLVLAERPRSQGLWRQFKSDAPDSALRSNLKVFLAGALEATTSYTAWALSHLSRHPRLQERVAREVATVNDYTPENLHTAPLLRDTLDETLRLTPSLYFLPRRSTVSTEVPTSAGTTMKLPRGTRMLLAVWHSNRHDEFWGPEVSGYPADQFQPDRWENLRSGKRASRDMLHFGFGHGPRVCPGKHLAQLEVALAVGAFLKVFRFSAVTRSCRPQAGVSTKPDDGTRMVLELR